MGSDQASATTVNGCAQVDVHSLNTLASYGSAAGRRQLLSARYLYRISRNESGSNHCGHAWIVASAARRPSVLQNHRL